MGAWKQMDVESERLTRAEAAMGTEGLAKTKELNVLVIGCRGVGVETAKNFILSNVGGVSVWDPKPATLPDMGANFYIREKHVLAGTR